MEVQAKISNRLTALFEKKDKNILSIYFTAGFPKIDDTVTIIKSLEESGVDIVEIGMPFSDPLADGPTIQQSSQAALKNGMNMKLLFEQLKDIRSQVKIPLLLMGYLNPVMQYGIENFCRKAQETGIDGVILPDLPVEEYVESYKELFESYNLSNIFLITPNTSPERIRLIDQNSCGFIYIVSTDSTTGNTKSIKGQEGYFKRVRELKLKNPGLVGFNVHDNESFNFACQCAGGAIVGSAFIKAIANSQSLAKDVKGFVASVKKL
jgi:tryptophan synthase alpha chain